MDFGESMIRKITKAEKDKISNLGRLLWITLASAGRFAKSGDVIWDDVFDRSREYQKVLEDMIDELKTDLP